MNEAGNIRTPKDGILQLLTRIAEAFEEGNVLIRQSIESQKQMHADLIKQQRQMHAEQHKFLAEQNKLQRQEDHAFIEDQNEMHRRAMGLHEEKWPTRRDICIQTNLLDLKEGEINDAES